MNKNDLMRETSDLLDGNYRYGSSFAKAGFLIFAWEPMGDLMPNGRVQARYMYDDVIRYDLGDLNSTPAELANKFTEWLDSNHDVY